MKKTLLALSLFAVAAPAFAADLPRNRAPVFVAPPMFTWTGFYLGANAGAVWGDFTKSGRLIDTKAGFTGGVTAGYNHQISNIVLGVEGDYNYSGLQGRGAVLPGPGFAKAELTSFGTIRARLGVAFDRALIYGTGGYAFGFTTLENGLVKTDSSRHGYAVGAGLEYAFTTNISAKAEYLYMPFESKNVGTFPGFGAAAKPGLDASVLRAGVNYRF